jgi:bacterioferritin (cytochrome b1)
VVTPPAEADDGSRRWLLRGAGAAAGGAAALIVAACGGSHKVAAQAGTTTTATTPEFHSRDIDLLNHLLELEHITVAAYTAGIPLLAPAGRMAGQRFLTQELSHAGELSGLVRQAGGVAIKAREGYDLGHPRNGDDVLKLLHELERSQIAAYLQAIPKASMASTRAALAAVMANDAQHISVLRSQLGRQPVPSALVTGHE